MPELPEVETVRRGLEDLLVGRTVERVSVSAPRVVRAQVGGVEGFALALVGRCVRAMVRRGKFMWALLDDDRAFVVHLGMSGQVRSATGEQGRHERARFVLSDGTQLVYVDQRMFGSLSVVDTVAAADGAAAGFGSDSKLLPASAVHIARDLLDPALDRRAVVRAIRRRSAPVKSLLLGQSLVSGFGNIYADEALFAAGVHGARAGRLVRARDLEQVLAHGERIMRDSLSEGGTSFDALYVNVNGESGKFASQLQVYGRAGQECTRCGNELSVTVMGGRSHVYCSECQPTPRGVA